MTLVVESPNEVHIPRPLTHQQPVDSANKRFKMLPCGRRWGKTRWAFKASINGHGPRIEWYDSTGVKQWRYQFPGIADATPLKRIKIFWVALDYGQAQEIWDEEIKPRFSGKAGVRISEKHRSITIGNGTLQIISSNNIDVIRGKKPDGIIFDEGAHYDLEYAWRRVARPALADNQGWAIFASTTDVGSYFNRLCTEVENGERGDEWGLFEGATSDNPKISAEEFESLKLEYPPGSSDMMQELYAKRLEAHGDLFKAEYFHYYLRANRFAAELVAPVGYRMPFKEIVITADLAVSLNEQADFTAFVVAGLGEPNPKGWRTGAILDITCQRLEAPDQIDALAKMIDFWHPNRVMIEAVAYQLSAVQHLRRVRPNAIILPSYPDKDKRSRAVPFAAAMSRGDVLWPRQSGWLDVAVKQLLKFPNGQKGSQFPEDHMDIVDACSMLALELNTETAQSAGHWGATPVTHSR